MPERKHKLLRRVDSAEVQGDDSWVLVKTPTMDDVRAGDMPAEGDQQAAIDYGRTVLGNLVKDWNWVDDDGNPLPKPTPEIVQGLPIQEVMFLMAAVGLDKLADQKN